MIKDENGECRNTNSFCGLMMNNYFLILKYNFLDVQDTIQWSVQKRAHRGQFQAHCPARDSWKEVQLTNTVYFPLLCVYTCKICLYCLEFSKVQNPLLAFGN